jgi:integrase
MGAGDNVIAWTPIRQTSFATRDDSFGWPEARKLRHPPCRLTIELTHFQNALTRTGLRPMTIEGYVKQLRATAKAAARMVRRPVGVRELFTDMELLAAAASDSVRLFGPADRPLDNTSLQARRRGVRAFISYCPELLPRDPDSLLLAFDEALTHCATPVGRGYRLLDRKPRRALPSPPMSVVRELIAACSEEKRGFLGARDAAFIATLATFGLRLSEAVEIKADDFQRLPGGIWVRVRQKSRQERAQLRVSAELSDLLEAYMDAFRGEMRRLRRTWALAFGDTCPFWRGHWGEPLKPQAAATRIRRYFRRLGWPGHGPQSIRRAVHREAIELIGRDRTALAMRRRGVETMDAHYGPQADSTEWSNPRTAVSVG